MSEFASDSIASKYVVPNFRNSSYKNRNANPIQLFRHMQSVQPEHMNSDYDAAFNVNYQTNVIESRCVAHSCLGGCCKKNTSHFSPLRNDVLRDSASIRTIRNADRMESRETTQLGREQTSSYVGQYYNPTSTYARNLSEQAKSSNKSKLRFYGDYQP